MKQKLIQQGAEAKIILTKNPDGNFIIKDRISKSYRHPQLDKQIRKRRTKSEAKLLDKTSKIINSPKPTDTKESEIKMPFIDGKKLSEHLDKLPLKKQKEIAGQVGQTIAKLHKNEIIHGDLTTSNMILVKENSKKENEKKSEEKEEQNFSRIKKVLTDSGQEDGGAERWRVGPKLISKSDSEEQIERSSGANIPASKASVYFIDFGLGYISRKVEDKAVDLHLLKQALEAKHFKNYKILQEEVFKAYEHELGKEESKKVFERITAVERRGRYRH